AAASPACATIELHEAYMTAEGAMGMRPVTGGQIPVPAQGEVELKPGGLHIMCIEKQVEFEVGTIIPLTLEFEQSGSLELDVEIRQP
ncbi:MAG: copper chaperone PCu(A)C, partial [Anaerolineales bacterium]|nr:copper chaperone PCu(A)C [Anaerolineales bacterium]